MNVSESLMLKIKVGRFLYHYIKTSLSLPYAPPYVFIEPTDHCNFKCIMCPHGSEENQSWHKGYMPLDLFESILFQVKQFKPLHGACLHLGGEPLLHPKLEEMIEMGKSCGIPFGLSTNGSLLNEKRIQSLVDADPEVLLITFSSKKKG